MTAHTWPDDEPATRELVDHEATLVRAALADATVAGDPVAMVALMYVTGDPAVATYGGVLTRSQRDRLADSGPEGLWSLWCPPEWPVQLDRYTAEGFDQRAASATAAKRKTKRRKRTFQVDVVTRIAHEIQHNPGVQVSEGFLAFAVDHEIGYDFFDLLRAARGDQSLAWFAERDLLRFPTSDP